MATVEEALQIAQRFLREQQWRSAGQCYLQILQNVPQNSQALAGLCELAQAYQAGNDHREALLTLLRATYFKPDYAPAMELLSTWLGDDLASTLKHYESEPQLLQCLLDAINNLGNSYAMCGEYERAMYYYRGLVACDPQFAEAHHNMGTCYKKMGRVEESLGSFRRALELKPDYQQALNHFSEMCYAWGRHAEVLQICEDLLRTSPQAWPAHLEMGICHFKLARFAEARSCAEQALHIQPHNAQAYNLLASAQFNLGAYSAAITAYQSALQIQPDYALAWHNLAGVYLEVGQQEKAIDALVQALRYQPDYGAALAAITHELRKICDWRRLPNYVERLRKLIQYENTDYIPPFSVLSMYPPSTPAEQLLAAKSFCDHHLLSQVAAVDVIEHTPPQSDKKIVVGYLSADFHNHATSYLIAELLEQHDRNLFEIIAFSYGQDDGSSLRRRIEQIVRFVDVRKFSTSDAVKAIRNAGVDILVDLKGYTKDSRAQILAHRPAPIQVNYLGYPGTMGAPFIDYIVADEYILPREQQAFITEKVVYLPDCYQANDGTREYSAQGFTRQRYGLPERAFVFCSFNANYKISPEIFDVWMSLLRAAPESVLWLIASNALAPPMLQRAAFQLGVDPQRLIFATPCEHNEHIARHGLADLFLDTFPVNAHTTASDALWAGLPLLTISGETFISRVAGSLLNTLELPELITKNLLDYETQALRMVCEPARLQELRTRLQQNRYRSSLFNARRFARKIEQAYLHMWSIHCAGESPRSFRVTEG